MNHNIIPSSLFPNTLIYEHCYTDYFLIGAFTGWLDVRYWVGTKGKNIAFTFKRYTLQ